MNLHEYVIPKRDEDFGLAVRSVDITEISYGCIGIREVLQFFRKVSDSE